MIFNVFTFYDKKPNIKIGDIIRCLDDNFIVLSIKDRTNNYSSIIESIYCTDNRIFIITIEAWKTRKLRYLIT